MRGTECSLRENMRLFCRVIAFRIKVEVAFHGGLTILDAALVFGTPGGFAQSAVGGGSQWAVVVGAFEAGTEFI